MAALRTSIAGRIMRTSGFASQPASLGNFAQRCRLQGKVTRHHTEITALHQGTCTIHATTSKRMHRDVDRWCLQLLKAYSFFRHYGHPVLQSLDIPPHLLHPETSISTSKKVAFVAPRRYRVLPHCLFFVHVLSDVAASSHVPSRPTASHICSS